MTTPNELLENYSESGASAAYSYARKIFNAYNSNELSKIWKIYKFANDYGDWQGRDGAYDMAKALGIESYLKVPPIVLNSYDWNAREGEELSYSDYEDETSLVLFLNSERRYQVKVYQKNENDEEVYIPFKVDITNQYGEYLFDDYDYEINGESAEEPFKFKTEEGFVKIDIDLKDSVEDDTKWYVVVETA